MSLFPLVLNEHPELEKVPEPLNLLGPREAFRFPSLQSFLDAIHKAEEGTRKESEAEDWGAVVNYCILVGHGALRLRGMKYDHDAVLNRSATKEEIEDMKVWLEEAMKAGAIGMSTGTLIECTATRHNNTTQHNTTQHNTTQHNTTPHHVTLITC